MPTPTQLHYSPPPPLHRRRRTTRWLVALAIVLALVLASRWVPLLWRHARFLYWQHQCLTNPVPPNTVVYSSGPPAVANVSLPWMNFYNVGWALGKRSSATVYLGQRTTKDGVKRLIAFDILLISLRPGQQMRIEVDGRVIQQGGLFSDPKHVDWPMYAIGHLWQPTAGSSPLPPPLPDVVVRSAIEDPADPSHLSFWMDVLDARYTFDGWLLANGKLRLEKKQGPRPTNPIAVPPI